MKIQLKRSNQLSGGSAKEPTAGQMEYGELAVNYNTDDPVIFIKDSDDNIVRIAGAGAEAGGVPNGGTGDRPTGPNVGDLFYDIDLNSILYWDGFQWVALGTNTIVQENPPSTNYAEGTLWFNSSDDEAALYILYDDPTPAAGKKWVQIAGGGFDVGELDNYVLKQGDNMTGALTIGPDVGPAVTTLANDGSAEFSGPVISTGSTGVYASLSADGAHYSVVPGANNTMFAGGYVGDTETVKFTGSGSAEFAGEGRFSADDTSGGKYYWDQTDHEGVAIGNGFLTAARKRDVSLLVNYIDEGAGTSDLISRWVRDGGAAAGGEDLISFTKEGSAYFTTNDSQIYIGKRNTYRYVDYTGRLNFIKQIPFGDVVGIRGFEIGASNDDAVNSGGYFRYGARYVNPGKFIIHGLRRDQSDHEDLVTLTGGDAAFAGRITTGGGIGGPYVAIGETITFNTGANDPANYTTTTVDGEEQQVYSGPTLDVKDRLTKTKTALETLKSAAAASTDFASLKAAIATALADI